MQVERNIPISTAGKQCLPFYPGDITIAEWVAEFKPEVIQVIPLFEDREHILESHQILREYLKKKDVAHQRGFLARSDPAMNYGMVSAVLCNKIALQRLRLLSQELGIEIYPILGVGSSPFRGNLNILRPSPADSSSASSEPTISSQYAFRDTQYAIRKC